MINSILSQHAFCGQQGHSNSIPGVASLSIAQSSADDAVSISDVTWNSLLVQVQERHSRDSLAGSPTASVLAPSEDPAAAATPPPARNVVFASAFKLFNTMEKAPLPQQTADGASATEKQQQQTIDDGAATDPKPSSTVSTSSLACIVLLLPMFSLPFIMISNLSVLLQIFGSTVASRKRYVSMHPRPLLLIACRMRY